MAYSSFPTASSMGFSFDINFVSWTFPIMTVSSVSPLITSIWLRYGFGVTYDNRHSRPHLEAHHVP